MTTYVMGMWYLAGDEARNVVATLVCDTGIKPYIKCVQ